MAFRLTLPRSLSRQWAVKIRDKERLEPPHVTILRGPKAWRWGLRERAFLDEEPDPTDVPQEIVDVINQSVGDLIEAWDEAYPENPVSSEEEVDNGNE